MKRWIRLAVLVLIGALVVGGALFYKHQKKMAKAEQLRSEAVAFVSRYGCEPAALVVTVLDPPGLQPAAVAMTAA